MLSSAMDTRLWETVYGDGGEHVSHVSGNVSSAVSSAVSSPRSQAQESGLNSLEYWDYSVELECIRGQQGNQEWGQEWCVLSTQFDTMLCHQLYEGVRLPDSVPLLITSICIVL